MTTSFDFDRLLSSVLEDGAQAASSSVLESALATARDLGQRRPVVRVFDRLAWPRGPHGVFPSIVRSPVARAFMVSLLILVLVALALAGAGVLRPDPKTTATAAFIRPFEYELPPGSLIRPSAELGSLVSWVRAPEGGPSPSILIVNAQQPADADLRGIIVGSGEHAWSHSASGRFLLRTEPAGFLADLRDTAQVPMGAITETTLDRRPAMTTDLPGTGGSDIHVNGNMPGLAIGTYALVTLPSRLIVADVDGTTVFILIWARTETDLQTWMPEADAFVRSIHFLPVGQP
jgi:hypothetical protein